MQRGRHRHVGGAGALLLEGLHCKSFWHEFEASALLTCPASLPVCMQWASHLVGGNGKVRE